MQVNPNLNQFTRRQIGLVYCAIVEVTDRETARYCLRTMDAEEFREHLRNGVGEEA